MLAVGDGVRQRESELLHRRRAGLAQVVATHVDEVPGRKLGRAVGEERRMARGDVQPAAVELRQIGDQGGRGLPLAAGEAHHLGHQIGVGGCAGVMIVMPIIRPESDRSGPFEMPTAQFTLHN